MKVRNPIRDLRVVEKRKTYIPHLLAIACLWLLAMSLSYSEEIEQEKERAIRIDREFTQCLRGEWRVVTEEGAHLGCMPVQIWEERHASAYK